MLRELGLGLLFLLAGYEIDPTELRGVAVAGAPDHVVRVYGVALVTVVVLGAMGLVRAEIAVAIALTSTALGGTLLPILADRGVSSKRPLGRSVLNHGAIGELLPVIAMATLLAPAARSVPYWSSRRSRSWPCSWPCCPPRESCGKDPSSWGSCGVPR